MKKGVKYKGGVVFTAASSPAKENKNHTDTTLTTPITLNDGRVEKHYGSP
jgi:hypothetical protein